MKKIIAFGASSSKKSINKTLAGFAAKQIKNSRVILLDLNDFVMPIYSVDVEEVQGIPKAAFKFKEELKLSDGIIISFAEHNGSYTAEFKNIFDWISRTEKVVWYNKPMFILATSAGSRGAISVLKTAYDRISRENPNFIPKFSLPNFYQNFDHKLGIINMDLEKEFTACLNLFEKNL